jgi:hypothetical protein
VFRHHRDALPLPNLDAPRVRTVRLLYNDEELQAAFERARAFERRDDYRRRRAGAYDRFLGLEEGGPADVVSITPIDQRGVAIVQMARTLSNATNAEGIEDEVTLNRLSGFGVELGQGYNTGQPGPFAS